MRLRDAGFGGSGFVSAVMPSFSWIAGLMGQIGGRFVLSLANIILLFRRRTILTHTRNADERVSVYLAPEPVLLDGVFPWCSAPFPAGGGSDDRDCCHVMKRLDSAQDEVAEIVLHRAGLICIKLTGGVRPYQQVLGMTASHGSIAGDPGMLLPGLGDAAERGALRTRYPVNQAVAPYPHPAAPFPPSFCIAKTSVIDFSSFWYPFWGKINIMVGIPNQEILPPTPASPPPYYRTSYIEFFALYGTIDATLSGSLPN
ncbi:hypothetical protein BDZ89DRAFT_1041590 [Hymenopellis radicata]|nr:hypothetical protein BDZ89DRAFT_1041590 [Hymenopellis radicata]